ncbi:hypothetical protein [Chryseobacterium luquanense]|uniref:DUF3828 domain-containing protein n=1 Tax=Chryseobacterium luquanense TaxID=2983766 RepID=A0ABT3Y372_9FLAO|nr:hypothetical protein [Chryseobacterium luquanense]MCX8532599.1 hypothetical protein [Chryseobacterium luquanense]
MKKLFCLLAVSCSVILFSQKSYSKISNSKISQERVQISEQFIKEYFTKCENKDFSKFNNFILDKRLERKLNENYEKNCEESLQNNGKITIKKFNSAYLQDFTKDRDPIEYIVFDADFEKSKDLKFVSVWIYRDQNVISGIWISKEKP